MPAPAERPCGVIPTLTYLVELAVGLACLFGAVVAWRRGTRWVAPILALAGISATVHAVVSLA
jgi:hypothetical protein